MKIPFQKSLSGQLTILLGIATLLLLTIGGLLIEFSHDEHSPLFTEEWHGLILWFVFLLLLIATGGAAVWWLVRRVIQPINQLTAGIHEIRNGNFDYALNIQRYDEIGRLAHAFDNMRQELSMRNQELTMRNEEIAELQQNLEARVDKRTKELESANRRLEAIAEALYQASQRANTANQAKSQFLANMSHELRTPLNSMIMYQDLLLRGAYGDLNPKQESRLRRSRESAEMLLTLISDVLDLAKIEAGELLIEKRQVELLPLLQYTANLVEPLLKNENVRYRLNLTDDVPAVLGDEHRIQQIVLNLLSNAAKFTQDGSIILYARHVTVKNGKITYGEVPMGIELPEDGDWGLVVVQDTGIGISQENQAVIFEEFKQVDDSNTREVGGTGLGLAICQRLVAAQGGHIGVVSEPAVGSQFWFILPTYDEEKETTSIVFPLRRTRQESRQ